jgi:hypothetical protein
MIKNKGVCDVCGRDCTDVKAPAHSKEEGERVSEREEAVVIPRLHLR